MEREKKGKDILMGFLLAGLVFQNVITPVVSRSLEEFSEQKNHHSTAHHSHKKPSCSTPSHGGSSTPSHGSSGGGYGLPTPFHGGGGGHGSSTPSHGNGGSYNTPTPSQGSGGHSGSPPCGGGHSSPAIIPTPSTPVVVAPVTPSHGSGGSYGTPTPSHGNCGYYNPPSSGGSPTIIPSPSSPLVESPVTPPEGSYNTPTPSHGGSGYYGYPPTPSSGYYGSPPTPPPTPSNGYDNSPPTPSSGYYNTPPSPVIESPFTPTPTTPDITPPSPWIPDPDSHPYFPGTCDYWRTHPEAIFAILGFLGNIGHFFGAASGSAFGKDLSLPEALANTRTDGIGALYREGTASLLNSLADSRFPFTTQQVKDAFTVAVTSDKAAATQAEIFKQANEGRLKF